MIFFAIQNECVLKQHIVIIFNTSDLFVNLQNEYNP